ncbi:Type III pantothenate kinase [Piscirickettsia salmonis]|uniref:type III pantothenate kinase n=1 Tax=Piscirickettsia salmonis TaxID=1238 RepID=UPI0012B94684|nr:type III pantothenate kinase [Piscirickettsia salmonis]QGN79649.1 Type III pantothenate kinase [Piscirickettsia salmonis]QGO29349.1 Type III pantothenate kinase [Piscirickettsia salmonis]QGP45233.1 Type III pantothenate kinase [Piscirickettsia salmonis]
MKLLLDIGLSRVKWARYHNGALQYQGAIEHHGSADHIFYLLENNELSGLKSVYIAFVGEKTIQERLEYLIWKHWQISAEFIVADEEALSIFNGYNHPEELEADRWLAMLALHNESLLVCIIDCGARITIDLLNNLGQHIGGLSFAGLKQLHLAAAQARGQKLTEFLGDDQQGFAEDSFLATNPRDAVLAGSFYSVVATLDRVAQDLQEAFQEGEGLRFVLTGGDAEQLQELLGFATDYRPELIFEGMLAYLQKKNQKKLAV